MKPPTTEALRYAATVLGRECTQLEHMIENVPKGSGGPGAFDRATREQCEQLLSYVRTVRTWILGVQMPIAERIDARKRVLARIRKAAASPLGIVSALAPEVAVKTCSDCGRTLSACELEAYDRPVCFYCFTGTGPTNCDECGAVLLNVVGPNVRGVVCPECNHDSALLEDEDDTHDPDCRCSECADQPLTATAGEALDRAIGKLVASNHRMALSAIESPIKMLMGAMIDPGELGPVACSHANAHPSKLVPAYTCPDCGALFRESAK
jgi:hypothetical protein